MTNEEFSREFDVLFQNMNSGGAPGILEYEKSLALTQAQESIVRQLLTGGVPDLISNLISTKTITPSAATPVPVSEFGIMYELPTNLLHIQAESVQDSTGVVYTVVPIPYTEWKGLSYRPYPYPRRRTAWRLVNSDDILAAVELIPRPNITLAEYKLTAVRYPIPIILDTVTETIRDVTGPSNTDLAETLHPDILNAAVQIAIATYVGVAQQQAR